jgi:hypothetical protein
MLAQSDTGVPRADIAKAYGLGEVHRAIQLPLRSVPEMGGPRMAERQSRPAASLRKFGTSKRPGARRKTSGSPQFRQSPTRRQPPRRHARHASAPPTMATPSANRATRPRRPSRTGRWRRKPPRLSPPRRPRSRSPMPHRQRAALQPTLSRRSRRLSRPRRRTPSQLGARQKPSLNGSGGLLQRQQFNGAASPSVPQRRRSKSPRTGKGARRTARRGPDKRQMRKKRPGRRSESPASSAHHLILK